MLTRDCDVWIDDEQVIAQGQYLLDQFEMGTRSAALRFVPIPRMMHSPARRPRYAPTAPLCSARCCRPLAALLAMTACAACAGLAALAPRDPASTTRVFSTSVTLRGQPFELHLAEPSRPHARDILVLYASGDGGWFGAAVGMFKAIGDDGFYAVGLSSRALLQRSTAAHPLTVAEIAEDYRVILEHAAEALNLAPGHRVVLTGWSRGASLAVLAGGARHAPASLAGIVAIGLAADEDLGVAGDSDDDAEATPVKRNEWSFDMYALLAQVAPRRAAVIQSTGDGYLRASRAQQLFGQDTDLRRFYAVTAQNHRFSGGAADFGLALRASLDWVVEDRR